MNDDPAALEEALNAAAVLGAALARFENALDRLRTAPTGQALSDDDALHEHVYACQDCGRLGPQ